jgi:hypothetical protein
VAELGVKPAGTGPPPGPTGTAEWDEIGLGEDEETAFVGGGVDPDDGAAVLAGGAEPVPVPVPVPDVDEEQPANRASASAAPPNRPTRRSRGHESIIDASG